MEKDKEYYLSILEKKVIISNPDTKIKYGASAGKEFDNELQCDLYDEKISRARYYDYLMVNRIWFMRVFNIKPSMKFYDEIQLKVTLNRLSNGK